MIRRAKKKKYSNKELNRQKVTHTNQDLHPIEEKMKHSLGSSNSEEYS